MTAEQFLFYEIRIASKLYLQGISVDDAAAKIREDNLFQYPTERQISRMARACYRRLDALNNQKLIKEISSAPTEIAKQINLYAIMRYNRLVWDFMIQVIGEKFRTQDFSFERKDLNTFFSRLQAQNDSIAGWSDNTINKIKSVLVRCLVETEYLDHLKSTTLNPVFLCEELEQGICENDDKVVSDRQTIIADRTSSNASERVFRMRFNLKAGSYDRNKLYRLVIINGTDVPEEIEFHIDIAMAEDFGFDL